MQESHGQDPASQPDPESCVCTGNGAGEALTGAHAGQPSSCEIRSSGAPTPLSEAEGNTVGGVIGEPSPGPAQSETLCTRGNSPHGKREIPQVPTELVSMGRPVKAHGRTTGVHAWGKSDDRVVPEKPPNNGEPVLPTSSGRNHGVVNPTGPVSARSVRHSSPVRSRPCTSPDA